MDRWMGLKAVLRIAKSNQKPYFKTSHYRTLETGLKPVLFFLNVASSEDGFKV